ncbi:hypothetical protein GGF46_004737 [Coemansia sp. RSA 552]|nr:hypothetical protein GGF46_004737 [Coemansia sp. RSA 552]
MLVQAACILGALAGCAHAHMEMIWPCPRYNANGIGCPALPPGESLDWNENAPIASGGNKLQPLCKYGQPWPTPAATLTAGETVSVVFSKHGAPHAGGHCEWSLSYDGGETFVVIHRELSHCFYDADGALQTNITFSVPPDVPSSSTAILGWTWVNAMGAREFYSNCADVAVAGDGAAAFTGPQMTVLNYPGHPMVPEFEGNYSVGLEYYEAAPLITVRALPDDPPTSSALPSDTGSSPPTQ